MKYSPAVYKDFDSFFSTALDSFKANIILYNSLVDISTVNKTNKAQIKVAETVRTIIMSLGWKAFLALAAVVAAGMVWYYGSLLAAIAAQPLLAAVLLLVGAGSIYIIWENRKFMAVTRDVGERYKKEFEIIQNETISDFEKQKTIEKLLDQCVASLCLEAFRISSEEYREKSTSSKSNINNKNGSNKNKIFKILFLAADPSNEARLRLSQEQKEIADKIRFSKLRNEIEMFPCVSAQIEDVTQALLDFQPNIIHFAGHGKENGSICFEDKLGKRYEATPEAISSLFAKFSNTITVVVLNACFSLSQAKAIVKTIPYVIGVESEITDEIAILFSIGFYQALGSGETIESAYELGQILAGFEENEERAKPILLKKEKAE